MQKSISTKTGKKLSHVAIPFHQKFIISLHLHQSESIYLYKVPRNIYLMPCIYIFIIHILRNFILH